METSSAGYVPGSRQAASDREWGRGYIQPTITGRERDLGVCGLLGIPLLSGLSLLTGMLQSLQNISSMPPESAKRNMHNGFSLKQELSSLVYFWF